MEIDLAEVFNKISLLSPLVSDQRLERIEEVVENRTRNIVPVLEHIYDKGNISAVMRSAEAFGFMNFHIIERPDGKFKVSHRVTQGSDKWLDITKHKTTSACLSSLKAQGFKVYATHLNASVEIQDIDFTRPAAIILGNEKDGVSPEALALCDETFRVPMYGFAQSFNISVAAALCFYHIHSYRCGKRGTSGDLQEEEKALITLKYLCKGIKGGKKFLRVPGPFPYHTI